MFYVVYGISRSTASSVVLIFCYVKPGASAIANYELSYDYLANVQNKQSNIHLSRLFCC